MRRTHRTVSIPGLVEALRQAGASFRQTSGGSWLLEAAASLPGWLQDAFFQADERSLAAFLRASARPDKAGSAAGHERELHAA